MYCGGVCPRTFSSCAQAWDGAALGKRLERRVRRCRPSAIIFGGTAGQLDPGVKLGTVIFPERWCFGDGRCYEQSR